jgi:hypothetical protein
MDRVQHLPVKEVARLWGKTPDTVSTWCRRKHIILVRKPDDRREKLVRVSDLPVEVHQA